MRTTITLSDEIIRETIRLSGKKRLSDAISVTLKEYFSLKKRLELLDLIFEKKAPHSRAKIKRDRRKKRWSSSTQAS